MKKVILNEDRCIGCGACMSVAPENFTFNDEGRAEMINSNLTDAAIEASEVCPVSAITIQNCCDCKDECNCEDNCSCDETCSCGCKDECNCEDNCNCDETCSCGCNE